MAHACCDIDWKLLLVDLYSGKFALELLQCVPDYTDRQLIIQKATIRLFFVKTVTLPSKTTTTLKVELQFSDDVY